MFFSVFKSQMPDILRRLKIIRVELTEAQDSIQQLVSLEHQLTKKEGEFRKHQSTLRLALDSFGVAIWTKDVHSRFTFVNQICCKLILKCTPEEALSWSNGDFKGDALAMVCMQSDEKVVRNSKTMRFIEHAIYNHDGHVFLDVVKSPIYGNSGVVIGTMGSAVEITANIPDTIKEHHVCSSSIEIPLESILCKKKLVELLERRANPRADTS